MLLDACPHPSLLFPVPGFLLCLLLMALENLNLKQNRGQTACGRDGTVCLGTESWGPLRSPPQRSPGARPLCLQRNQRRLALYQCLPFQAPQGRGVLRRSSCPPALPVPSQPLWLSSPCAASGAVRPRSLCTWGPASSPGGLSSPAPAPAPSAPPLAAARGHHVACSPCSMCVTACPPSRSVFYMPVAFSASSPASHLTTAQRL